MRDEQREAIMRRVDMDKQDGEAWMQPCKCAFAQKVLSDGCDICNPERAKELGKEDDDDE